MRLATWNVNSLKARLPRVEAWLADVAPDVVCLQETKLADATFPALAFQALGYESAHHGLGQWNGVAILSRVGLDDPSPGFDDGGPADPDARILWATCGGIRIASVYVPNGRTLDHEQYRYKLDWLARLKAQVAAEAPGRPLVVAGDFNVAPEDRDVWDIAAFAGSTHVSEPERAAVAALASVGLTDLFRHCWPSDDRLYTYWDYRAGDFHQGRGMRIDLVLGSAPVVARTRWCVVDRNARKGTQPSDHAPVVVDLTDAAEG